MALLLTPFLLALLCSPVPSRAWDLSQGDTGGTDGTPGSYPGAGRASVYRRHALRDEEAPRGFPGAGRAMARRRYARAHSDAPQSLQGRSGGAFHRDSGRGLRVVSGAQFSEPKVTPFSGPEHSGTWDHNPGLLQGGSATGAAAQVRRRRASTRARGAAQEGTVGAGSLRGREALALRRGERPRAQSASGAKAPASAPAPAAACASSPAAGEPVGAGGSPSGSPKGPTVRWHQVAVRTLGGPSPLSWVVTVGEGVVKATVYKETCFQLAALTRCGARIDLGEDQRAWLVAYLSSAAANVTLLADVTYDPAQSTHRVCYSAPTVGGYSLEVKVVFTNAYNLTHVLDPVNALGFANYTLVLSSQVEVSGPRGFDLVSHRKGLPVCTARQLSDTRNRGYWAGNTWFPLACRMRRLEQAELLQCLDGKRVLMIGDSETRILYGILQAYLFYKSREAFLSEFKTRPFFYGDLILHILTDNGVPEITTPQGPPLNQTTGLARKVTYEFLNGTNATFYGSIYEGFSVQKVTARLSDYKSAIKAKPGATATFNLTLSSLFTIGGDVFSPWKLEGNLTDGVNVSDGGMPADVVFVANQLHDVRNYNTSEDYTLRLISHFMPLLFPLLKSPDSFYMQGGLTSIEARKLGDLYGSGNPRIVDFEDTSQKALVEDGFHNFLRIQPLTAPRPDLAFDATHYTWPVSIAIIDMWLGTFCTNAATAI